MPHITTRSARRADLGELRQMITAVAAHHGDVAQIDLDHLNRDLFGSHPWVHVLVACHGTRVVGYAALCPLVKLQYCARGMDLNHLFVVDDLRRHGVGRKLIDTAIDHARARHCSYLMVGTDPDNDAAKRVYLACGFTPLAHNPDRFSRAIN
ncbi:Acetyltransferase (GNAT) family protein [Cognatiyoonia koreensis]|uniref:Acetyltransferase (GNAT) family protein n=1 Tax=Cognatiyoonia koreensis TaxID=364200 RepID=A0A1I0NHY5_9RHOB|nr:GNAT family N-acetyltransferase [Cognatiyoonia koreensis]SEW01045.1 Acetyltransferase (GNAT) family protein [Cognatiyoonia koreensis]